MSDLAQYRNNSTIGMGYIGIVEVSAFAVLTSLPCCLFIFINCTMLCTLRSKAVFYETPRYVLVFNLLLADTLLLFQTQTMYLLSACRVKLGYYVCFSISMTAQLNGLISPLTLLVMSLERYVAVCYPLRHISVVTIRNTGLAIVMIWLVGFQYVFVQVALQLKVYISKENTEKMSDYCGKEIVFHNSVFHIFKRTYIYFWYVFTAVVITSTYIGVMVAAMSASTDKASAERARKTLILHMVQLIISLCSPAHDLLVLLFSKHLNRVEVVRLQVALYVCVIMFPRCLSSLVYGLRDQTIRPALVQKLLCGWKGTLSISVHSNKVKVSCQIPDGLSVKPHLSKLL